jgi:cell division protein FtsL
VQIVQGKKQLEMAKVALVVSALLAVFFAALSVVLALHWRKSLIRFFK